MVQEEQDTPTVKQRRDRERKARERRKERTLHAEEEGVRPLDEAEESNLSAQFVESTVRTVKKIGGR